MEGWSESGFSTKSTAIWTGVSNNRFFLNNNGWLLVQICLQSKTFMPMCVSIHTITSMHAIYGHKNVRLDSRKGLSKQESLELSFKPKREETFRKPMTSAYASFCFNTKWRARTYQTVTPLFKWRARIYQTVTPLFKWRARIYQTVTPLFKWRQELTKLSPLCSSEEQELNKLSPLCSSEDKNLPNCHPSVQVKSKNWTNCHPSVQVKSKNWTNCHPSVQVKSKNLPKQYRHPSVHLQTRPGH